MRYLFGFMCVLAVGVMGCSETAGTGGSGGDGGSGGSAGSGGVGSDCSGVEDGSECMLGDVAGQCFEGVCLVLDCSGAEDGADCIGGGPRGGFFGLCVAGSCERLERCEDDEVCRGYSDCSANTCLSNGLCQENGAVEDGTQCAGGTCQSGECVLEGSRLPCTEQGIRNAIAAGGGPYVFACQGPTKVATQAQITIDNDVILDGERNLIVDGGNDHTVFGVLQDVSVELRGVTITNGGRGIWSEGALVLVRSEVRGCEEEDGAGISINGPGTLTLIESTVSGNRAVGIGGGIRNTGTMATLVNSTVSGNVASQGGGIGGDASALILINSTISGNSAESGSAIYHSDNDAPGIPVAMAGTLVEGDCVVEGGATLASDGYNIESPGDTCGFDQTGDLVNITEGQLELGELADNGGPTMTHALGAGSVAIDHIPALDCEVTTDQRGEPRPGGAMCDVGAFERQPSGL